jgi:hypothetical protein
MVRKKFLSVYSQRKKIYRCVKTKKKTQKMIVSFAVFILSTHTSSKGEETKFLNTQTVM